jgi:hypothetical protein
MPQSMTRRIARLVGRDGRTETKMTGNRLRPASIARTRLGEGGGPATERFRHWLLAVPWRHVWILVLPALLLAFALFGFFPRH